MSGLDKSWLAVTNRWSNHCAAVFGSVLSYKRKEKLYEIFLRLAAATCDECCRPIRFWQSRLTTDRGPAHRSCWENKRSVIEFVRWFSSQHSQNSVHENELSDAIGFIESIASSFHQVIQHNGDASVQSEYVRGMLCGARSMLMLLRGKSKEEIVLTEVCRRIGGPLPSALPLAEDGNRYGWDGPESLS